MASPPLQGTHERSISPSPSVESLPAKEPMASQSESLSFKKAMPTRQTTIGTLEAPFKFKPGKMVSLSPVDHAFVCHAIGAICDDHETQSLSQPKSGIYPPKGLPDGLYRDVIRARVVCAYQYYFCMIWFNVALFLQLLLGAATTALASASKTNNLIVTILAAANTINAGVLALMHNSGLPDRYKNDGIEYEAVEMYMRELIDGAIVREGVSREDV